MNMVAAKKKRTWTWSLLKSEDKVRTEETLCPGLPEEIAPNFDFICYSIDHAGGSSDPYGTDDLYRHEKRRLQYDQEPTVVGYVFSIFSKFWLISGNL